MKLRNSRIKGHHAFRTDARIGDEFHCHRKAINRHSEAAIVVRSSSDRVMGHIPDRLARIFSPMLDDRHMRKIIGTVTGPARLAPEGVWRIGGEIELLCQYVLYGFKKHRTEVRRCLRNVQRKKTSCRFFIMYSLYLPTPVFLCYTLFTCENKHPFALLILKIGTGAYYLDSTVSVIFE